MLFRFATIADASLLAPLNHQLIRDEGHRNPMSVTELESRMAGWLAGAYEAVLVLDETDGGPVAYALFRHDEAHVYLRQLFVVPGRRRQGLGLRLMDWLRASAWPEGTVVRLDVLAGNLNGRAFWESAGFEVYCLTMESTARQGG